MKTYQAFDTLQRHRARLHNSVALAADIQLAAWSNECDRVTQLCDHHTLSLYTHQGQHTWHRTPGGWKNGGGTDRFCLMPAESESSWDIRGAFTFVHLYCTDAHLRDLAEKIWDRSPRSVTLEERIFAEDDRITQLYRQFLLSADWQQQASQLMLSSAASLLLIHLLQHYSSVQWRLPAVRGGLAPAIQRQIIAWIDDHLAEPLTLKSLADRAGLSEYHFARMFRHSMHIAPHQYVMQRRMVRAGDLLRNSRLPLTEIALLCGFSSASHFSHRFRLQHGVPPSRLRAGEAGSPPTATRSCRAGDSG
ncbi:helix-turn-helix domain-containing protein [Pantoea sp. 1.19]|uniref:helix-turn-helix domain-containing protein n=1 Tax=Pantoea sp. 1.19 TaxID=1925589 RepID=UPI000948AF7D|nr:helix-turn-helix domain-containing protein [Pantoea sp. 1.19]